VPKEMIATPSKRLNLGPKKNRSILPSLDAVLLERGGVRESMQLIRENEQGAFPDKAKNNSKERERDSSSFLIWP